MIINSNHMAIMRKEIPLTIVRDAYEDPDGIGGQLTLEDMAGIFLPDYLIGTDCPDMLVDTEQIEYHIICFNPYISPHWLLEVLLPPLEMTEEQKQELLSEAQTPEELDIIQYMIEETEAAQDYGGDGLSFDLTLSPEEQKFIFDLANVTQYEQDYILRLQNL